ncbi:MAG: tRNA uridine(34) 5-carboxymethylaminomethyl modification radical SAM/GNAT enzyme Elp3 [Candidatus Aenigmarchaeota archaeon]|nr:tRNA uridine(34) 5-carboxymethylaminomethyl modification radical SAM/GNAT enzyme Elp3 [Candidatus Aenigmarchaeota archaeon]MDI6721928.1 tRNA uridine(34) 5-carboxymethylaminomethyl modification radical SAM/GNAT enzyme Elp3 [Candidatus Aenigmarchaeota archaeon]
MNINQMLLCRIRSGEIASHDALEIEKVRLAGQLGTGRVIKNAEILEAAQGSEDYETLKRFLLTKPVRTSSGIANIAIMWKYKDLASSCPFSCIYCPQGKEGDAYIAPKSYTGVEPTTLRAIRNKYDPALQIKSRLKQFHLIGHSTDKCELIIMGGTFMCTPPAFREDFIKQSFDAFNGEESKTLEEAHIKNESAANRCIGLTIETRADVCLPEQMLSYGCTRVEVGVQSTDEDILLKTKRGHGIQSNIKAFKNLKEAGLKICAHWMPGLTGIYGKTDLEKELSMFKELFENPDYRPDELKIYPTLVIPGTELYDMWKKGEFAAMTQGEMIRLLIGMKKTVPPYVRIKRIMRDISEKKVVAGAKTTNLRQLAQMRMQELELKCRCIRCREIKLKDYDSYKFNVIEYEASGGREFFLSFDAGENIVAFLRLRLDNDEAAKVRELHVYGKMAPLRGSGNAQHKGFGSMLLEKAEEIARENGKNKIQVTSGIGVRSYYIDKFGYKRDGYYVSKFL